jgi:hypothetical protein
MLVASHVIHVLFEVVFAKFLLVKLLEKGFA